MNLLTNGIRAFPVVSLGITIFMIYILVKNEKNFEFKGGTDKDKAFRTSARGTLVSLLSALVLTGVSILMTSQGVNQRLILNNFGFIFAPIVGYLLDQTVGTDQGWSKVVKGDLKQVIEHMFGSLATGECLRYILTIFIDMFISSPFQDMINFQAIQSGILDTLMSTGSWYDSLLVNNFPSIMQAVVGILTFQAYTNQTRFNWAYSSSKGSTERIPNGVILLSTALAGVFYLTSSNLLHIVNPDIFNFNMNSRLGYTLFTFGLLFLLVQNNKMDPDDDDSKRNKKKTLIGVGLFMALFMYGVVIPFTSASP